MKEGQRLLPYIGPVDEAVSRAVERNIGTLSLDAAAALAISAAAYIPMSCRGRPSPPRPFSARDCAIAPRCG